MNLPGLLVLLLAATPILAAADDRALPKAVQALDHQARPSQPPPTGFHLSGDSTEISAQVAPPPKKGSPANASLNLRQHLSDQLTARAESSLLVDTPDASPAATGLPTMRKQESFALQWAPSNQFGAEAFTRLSGQTGGETFFDRADLERGATLSLQPTPTTRTSLSARHREGLDDSPGPRTGDRLDASLSQKLGHLPLTASISPAAESTRDGPVTTHSLASRQALIWNASADTILSAGTRLAEHESSRPGDSHRSLEAFTRWERTVSPDLALSAQTSVENRLRPDLDADRHRRQFTLQAGPSYRLADDLSASLDFKSSFEHRDRRGLRDAEQAVSFSLNGKF